MSACAKYTALTLMLVQNASFVLVMRYSRRQQQSHSAIQYNIGVVVTLQETFKLVLCIAVLALSPGGSLRSGFAPLTRPRELIRIAIPALCFTLQNNILYVALSNLDPLIFQITYQVKTLLTALFSVVLLGKSLTRVQWLSQLLLMAGIVLVQLSDAHAKSPSSAGGAASTASPAPATASTPAATAGLEQGRNLPLGLAAVIVAAVSSAFASVWFERLLKSDAGNGSKLARGNSLWDRNIELSAWTVPLNALLGAMQSSRDDGGLAELFSHPLKGFEASTWAIVVVNGIGGLLVAAVIKYADNIWKGFATAAAIVFTGTFAPLLGLGPAPTVLLLLGAALVIASIVMYAMPQATTRPAKKEHDDQP